MTTTLDQARAAKAKLRTQLKSDADVVGIGIGRDEASYCVKVNLSCATRRKLPETVDGVKVHYEVVGTIRPAETR